METKFLGASAISDEHRRSTFRIKKFVFHSTSAMIADAASQKFHMKTEHRRSSAICSPIIADELRFNENQALQVFFLLLDLKDVCCYQAKFSHLS